MMIAHRKLIYVLPCALVAGLAVVTGAGCGAGEEAPPPLTTASMRNANEAGDMALRHDVTWAATAAARCAEQGATRSCATRPPETGLTTGSLRPRGLRPRGIVSDVLAQLPVKPIICAIARKYRGGSTSGGSSMEAGVADAASRATDAAMGADAGVPQDARPAFDIWGGRAAVENGGAAQESAALHEVWDMERCQAAVFVHPTGGVTKLTGKTGYRGPGRGATAGVIEAGGGSFVLDGELAEPAHVRKVGAVFFADLAVAAGPEGLPLIEGAFIAAHRGATTYVPWDTGTQALLALRTGKNPRLDGDEGARFVQYEADPESGTTCGAQMPVAMLTQTSDTGDFESSAGAGALTAIATGVAQSLGLDLETWCGDAEGTGTGDGGTGSGTINDGTLASSTSCHAKDPGFCGALSCTPNGDGVACCRSEPTGNEACPTGNDAECAPGYVCSIKRKPVTADEPTQVCVRREACR